MNQARSDHAILYFKGLIYVFGGMSLKTDSKVAVQSLNTCEVYNMKEDKWTELPPFENSRQAFTVCTFNDKYIFIFGGKKLREGATIN